MNRRRKGRKLGTFVITAGDGAATVLGKIDYSLDSEDGWFFATFEERVYEGASRDDLERQLRELLRSRHNVEYDPYIDVEMPGAFGDDTTVVGLKFHLVWISREQVSSYGTSKHWLEKHGYFDLDEGVIKQGVGRPKTRDSRDGLVAYTPERYAKLQQIEKAIEETHARLKAILFDVAALDAVGPTLLLVPPAEVKKKGRGS